MAAAITQPVSTLRWNNGRHWHNSQLRKAGYRCLTSLTGFARGLEEDAEGLRAFAAMHKELIVASSYSKNFGLYNERVGACTLVAADSETVDRAFSQMKAAIRANYSNPPAHGASVVATILSNDALRAIWEQELTDMRQRIQRMRQLFVNTLQEKAQTATSALSSNRTACSPSVA